VVATTISSDSVETAAVGRPQFPQVGALSRRELIAVIVVTGLALALCLIDLGGRSLWLDEFHSAFLARAQGESLWHSITSDGGNMIGYYAFLHAWVLAFGWGPLALRLPSAFAGAALVPVVFLLGRRAGGPRVGLVATLLVAVSPPLVVWAQQARGYSIAVLAVSLTWLMLVRLQASPTRGRHVTFCVFAIVTTYFLLTASLIVASGLLCLYLASADGRAKAKVMASAAIYLLGCLPLALTVLGAGVSGAVSWVAAPTWSSVRSLMSELSSGSVPDFFPPHLANAVLTGIVVLCWGAALATLFRSRRRRCATKSVIAVIPAGFVFWLVIPVFLDWIISVVRGDSIFGTSFLLPIVPGGLLLAAYGLASLRWQVGTLAGTVVLVGLSLAVLVPTYRVSNENWKGAAAFVLTAAHHGDCVAFDAPSGVREFAYYVNAMDEDDAYPRAIFPRQTWAQALASSASYSLENDYTASALSDARRDCGRVWVVMNRSRSDFEFAAAEVAYAMGSSYHETRHYGFTGITVDLISKR